MVNSQLACTIIKRCTANNLLLYTIAINGSVYNRINSGSSPKCAKPP